MIKRIFKSCLSVLMASFMLMGTSMPIFADEAESTESSDQTTEVQGSVPETVSEVPMAASSNASDATSNASDITYTVSFYNYDGTLVKTESVTNPSGTGTVNIPVGDVSGFTAPEGYKLSGFGYKRQSESNTGTATIGKSSTSIISLLRKDTERDVYAYYSATVKINYDYNGGTLKTIPYSSGTVNYPQTSRSLQVTSMKPTFEGHTFLGWSTDKNATEAQYNYSNKATRYVDVPVGNVTLYAVWQHTAGETVVENNVDPTCTKDGSYDEAVYCTVCNKELSRKTVTVAALGHKAGETVVENNVDPTCTKEGSYDNVVYCTVCKDEISRKTVTVAALGHKAGETVVENKVDPTCTKEGSYDNVVYCTVCKDEISRETIKVAALGHKEGKAVIENYVKATDKKNGSYDEVVYCTVCKKELSRKKVTIPVVNTGVQSNTALFAGLLTASAAGVALMLNKRNKE